ncbi:MAG TPA: sphingomyelin phosphodiesterase [Chitinophagales bacterium]|nr:sphingomyelin phosphodiesterase [Chitinophagales bacterium]HRK27985.1 sphingomyelin phosphodiesterase [Chitinophagales bacterium]
MERFFKLLAGIAFMLYGMFPAFAESYIFLQNNTSLPLNINTTLQSAHQLSDDAWWGKDGIVEPWSSMENVLWTNRNKKIKNNTNYIYNIHLNSGTDTATFKVWVKGYFIGSTIKFAFLQPNEPLHWHNNRNFHDITFPLGGKTVTLKFAASNKRGAYSDITLALHERNPYPPANPQDMLNPHTLNVLTYNVYMLPPPLAFTHQKKRAALLPAYLHGYDAIILNEVFYNAARKILLKGLAAEYPYQTKVLDKKGRPVNGGVVIVSRWPIEKTDQYIYTLCASEDCYAAKGVMYAQINKLGKKYHLFGTHAQADDKPKYIAIRKTQMEEMSRFVLSKNIPPDEPTLIGGDLNVEKLRNNLNEYCFMLDVLKVTEPTYGNLNFTCHGNLNYYTYTPPVYLDYILPLNTALKPLLATNEVRILRTLDDNLWNIFDLSDHFSVYGRFVFEPTVGNALLCPPVYLNDAPIYALQTDDTQSFTTKLANYWQTTTEQSNKNLTLLLAQIQQYLNEYQNLLMAQAYGVIDTAAVNKQIKLLQQQKTALLHIQTGR